MKRRQFIVGLGGAAGAVGLVMGSGAYSSVKANRAVSVETADDNEAYLGLEELGAGTRSVEQTEDNQTEVVLNFPGYDETNSEGDGLGKNSTYEFDYDNKESPGDTAGLFRIMNQGEGGSIDVYSENSDSNELYIEIYDVTDSSRTALKDDPATLDAGKSVDVGVRIETYDSTGEFDETLRIVGEKSNN